jgi:hypothetical protein
MFFYVLWNLENWWIHVVLFLYWILWMVVVCWIRRVCSVLVLFCSCIIDMSKVSDYLLSLFMFHFNFNSRLIYFNSEISRSNTMRNFDIQCNNFSKRDNTWRWPYATRLDNKLHLRRQYICILLHVLILGILIYETWRFCTERHQVFPKFNFRKFKLLC